MAVGCFDEAVRQWLDDPNPARPRLGGPVQRTYAELAAGLRS